MSEPDGPRPTLLPPPAATILRFAADGLAVRRGEWSPSARPKALDADQWAPLFRRLLGSAEGLSALEALAEAGMRAWGCSDDQLACLRAAFADITFKASADAVLGDLMSAAAVRHDPPGEPPHPWPFPKPGGGPTLG